MLDALDISASALAAQRLRMDTVAGNVANMNTLANEKGENEPYRRRFVVFAPGQADNPDQPGVRVLNLKADPSPFRLRFEPGHPLADDKGYVKYPNIDLGVEMVNMMEAARAYEASVTTIEVSKSMMNASLRLLA